MIDTWRTEERGALETQSQQTLHCEVVNKNCFCCRLAMWCDVRQQRRLLAQPIGRICQWIPTLPHPTGLARVPRTETKGSMDGVAGPRTLRLHSLPCAFLIHEFDHVAGVPAQGQCQLDCWTLYRRRQERLIRIIILLNQPRTCQSPPNGTTATVPPACGPGAC